MLSSQERREKEFNTTHEGREILRLEKKIRYRTMLYTEHPTLTLKSPLENFYGLGVILLLSASIFTL